MKKKSILSEVIIREDGSVSTVPQERSQVQQVYEEWRKRGLMSAKSDGSTEFTPNAKLQVMPPMMDKELQEENLIVRRTTRNFVVQMKFPIIESAEETTKAHRAMWRKVTAVIKAVRGKIKDEL